MTSPSKLAVEIAEAISPKALDNSPTDAGDRAAIAAIIDAKIRPLVEDGEKLRFALLAQKYSGKGQCFCEMSIGNPMYKTHSNSCRIATETLAAIDHARAQRPAQEGSDKT